MAKKLKIGYNERKFIKKRERTQLTSFEIQDCMDKEKIKFEFHRLFWYFLIFSIAGLIIETLYCYITTGVLESRKGLIWGPFCPVYGVGAVVLILLLEKYKNKNICTLFIYGFIGGSIAEYLLSFGLEAIYGIRFWDYAYTSIHLNGRIGLQFSIYWGILSAILIKFVMPIMDKYIDKIPMNIKKIFDSCVFVFLVIDCLFTVWGIQTYENRVINKIEKHGEDIISKVENNYFTNERMKKNFPNLRVKDKNGNEIWVRNLIEK